MDGRQLVVGDEEVGVPRLCRPADLLDLPLAEVERRRRCPQLLDDALDDRAAGRLDQPHQLLERLFDLPPSLRGQPHRPDDGPLAARHRGVPTTVLHAVTSFLHAGVSRHAIVSATAVALPVASTSIHSMSGSRMNQVHCRLA